MFDREISVWHTYETDFKLQVEQPTWRKLFRPLATGLISVGLKFWIPGVSPALSWAGHRILNWDTRSSTILARIPISREDAKALSYSEDDWDWLDD